MELFTPDFGLIFWMFVAFGVLFLVLWKFAWPMILKTVDSRADLIDKGVEYAQAAKEQLDNAREEANIFLNEARRQQADILREADKMKTQIIEQARSAAQVEAQKVMDNAKLQIRQQQKEAQQQFLGAALLLGFQGKLQGVQILADGAGEGFSENFKILEHLLLGQSQERLPKLGLLIFLPVHIAAAYAGDGAVVLGEKFLDFRYFLFYHMYLVSAYVRRALQWEYLLLGKVKCRKPGEVWVLRHCKMGRSAEF
jgi:F-type H+-transporting ATPase subunit b